MESEQLIRHFKDHHFLNLADIMNFFQWRKLEEHNVIAALDAFLKVSPEEIVKVCHMCLKQTLNIFIEITCVFEFRFVDEIPLHSIKNRIIKF